jgi:hypothetical protein
LQELPLPRSLAILHVGKLLSDAVALGHVSSRTRHVDHQANKQTARTLPIATQLSQAVPKRLRSGSRHGSPALLRRKKGSFQIFQLAKEALPVVFPQGGIGLQSIAQAEDALP